MKTSALNLIFPSLDASILFTSKITICGWKKKKCSQKQLTSCFQGTELSQGEQNLFTPNQTRLATLFWKKSRPNDLAGGYAHFPGRGHRGTQEAPWHQGFQGARGARGVTHGCPLRRSWGLREVSEFEGSGL